MTEIAAADCSDVMNRSSSGICKGARARTGMIGSAEEQDEDADVLGGDRRRRLEEVKTPIAWIGGGVVVEICELGLSTGSGWRGLAAAVAR